MINENLIKHLEFIQNVITRMNNNSFYIKNWTITIVSAFIAVFASTQNIYFVITAIFPTIVFWLLDAYYLNMERKYRSLYNDVAGISTINNNIKTFEMSVKLYHNSMVDYFRSLLSITLLFTYPAIIVCLAALVLLFK